LKTISATRGQLLARLAQRDRDGAVERSHLPQVAGLDPGGQRHERCHGRADRAKQRGVAADAAAEHDERRVDDGADRGDRHPDATRDSLDDGVGGGVAGFGELEGRAGGVGLRPVPVLLSHRGEDPGRADLVLEGAVEAVAPIERIVAGGQVADLARRPVSPPHELVIDRDPHADPGADGDEDERGDPLREPVPLLADGREIDVVLNQDREREALGDDRRGIEATGRTDVIGQGRHPPRRLLDHARRGDSDGEGLAVAGAGEANHLGDQIHHLRAHGPGIVLDRRLLALADHVAVDVGRAGPEIGAADVDPDDEAGPLADDIGHRLASGPPVSGSGRMDQLRALEPAHHRRDRRLRQVRAGGDLGAGDRSRVKDRLEDRLLAQLSQGMRPRVRRARPSRRVWVRAPRGQCPRIYTEGRLRKNGLDSSFCCL
jgi:hypothetical protein